jgi:hypothetical protein
MFSRFKLGWLLRAVAAFAALTPAAAAIDAEGLGKPTTIETTYVPNVITFQVAFNTGSCSAGTWLTYVPSGATAEDKQANIQANLSALMTALAANRDVWLGGLRAGCIVQYIHLR